MTDAPERIWAGPDGRHWSTEDIGNSVDVEYVRADVAAAMVAAALREAAEVAYQWWDDDDAQELRDVIRALIPDAGAALDRALEKAREEGRQELREACLQAIVNTMNRHTIKKHPEAIVVCNEIAAALRARVDQGEKK